MATEMKGLDPALIQTLVQNSRTRNAYGPKVIEFNESDEAAINPAEVWPMDFGTKNAATLYQGFITAIKKASLTDIILVKKVDESVFLLHKDRVAVVLEAKATAEAEAETSQNGNAPSDS